MNVGLIATELYENDLPHRGDSNGGTPVKVPCDVGALWANRAFGLALRKRSPLFCSHPQLNTRRRVATRFRPRRGQQSLI